MENEAASGQSLQGSFARYDRNTHLLKTHQCSLFEGGFESLQTLPNWGIMQDGELWELVTPAHLMYAREYGYWQQCKGWIPTPTACDYKGSGFPREGRGPGNNLRDWFKQLYGLLYPPVNAVEYLQGIPLGWTDCTRSVISRFHKWLRSHGEPSQENAPQLSQPCKPTNEKTVLNLTKQERKTRKQ